MSIRICNRYARDAFKAAKFVQLPGQIKCNWVAKNLQFGGQIQCNLVAKFDANMQITDIASARKRVGYRRINVMLQRSGEEVNHKRMYRIYCEKGLQVRKRRRKKERQFRKSLEPARGPNERWSMDFVIDTLATGRRIPTANVVDECTRDVCRSKLA